MVTYRLKQDNRTMGYAFSIDEARYKAFGFLMKKKKEDVFILNDSTGGLVGAVFYETKRKDRYGRVLGPMYWSERKGKEYLLDLDGSLFDIRTNKRVPGQRQVIGSKAIKNTKAKKTKRSGNDYGIKGDWRPFEGM